MQSSSEILKILEAWANESIADIRDVYENKPQNGYIVKASGRFGRSLQSEQSAVPGFASVKITGASHTRFIQDGRKPTPAGAPRSEPSLYEVIQQWIKDKGIVTDNPKTLAFFITRKIHRDGFKQRMDISAIPNVDNLTTKILDVITTDVRKNIWQSPT